MKRIVYNQISFFDQLGFYEDGVEIEKKNLNNVVSFNWLEKHVGYQVAMRYSQESLTYYVVYTVSKLVKKNDGVKRIVLSIKGKEGPMLDEDLFFLGRDRIVLLYEL